MTRPPTRLSTVVMCHPSRLASAERVAGECRPLPARIVQDPDPGGYPSPLRTAKVAWAAIEPGATHHMVVQDDVHLAAGFAEHVGALLDRHPGCAVSLGVLWVSPYNSYRVRQAAVGGYAAVRLAPWEWVPSLGLALPADTARELAAYLATFPDVTRDDDEHIAVFCAERGIPVVAPVPHVLDHSTQPSVAGNDHHGVRLGVACADGPVDAGHWAGPVLADPALHDGLGYAVELVASRCHVRMRRSGEQEPAEQPFTWPWRPWSALLGVAWETIAAAARAAGPAPGPLPEELAAEVWAAGFLLGALTPGGGDERPGHRDVREEARAAALRSWITAGLRPDDLAELGAEGCEAAAEWAGRAVAAGLGARAAEPAGHGTDDTEAYDEEQDTEAYEPAKAPADPAPGTPDRAALERMARREARLLLRPAPEELPDVRLRVVPCPEHPDADPALTTRDLPVRWLGEHLSEAVGDSALVVLACERLEPRPLAGLAALLDGGWKGVVETRAATAARLRAAGLRGAALTAAVDDAERRFEAGDGAAVTLPAACRAAGGGPRRLWPHDDPELSAGDGLYARLRLRHVREIGL